MASTTQEEDDNHFRGPDDGSTQHHLETRVKEFLKSLRPFNKTLTYAQSLDAKISGPGGRPLTISCPESFRVTHELRRCHDMILVGVGTALSDDPGLNARGYDGKAYPLGQQPIPVILDPSARLCLTPKSKLLINAHKGLGHRPIHIVRESFASRPQADSHITLTLPGEGKFKWQEVYSALEGYGKSIMIEGGATIIQDVIAHDAADRIIVTVAPTFVGEGTFISLANTYSLTSVETKVFGRDCVIAGRPRKQTQGR